MVKPLHRISLLVIAEHALVSRRALKFVAAMTVVVVVAAGAAVTATDGDRFSTVWDGLWWASTTVTTVGYGDIVPQSALGRAIAVALMFTGIGLVSILTASIASALLAEDVGDEERHIERELAAISETLGQIQDRLASLEHAVERNGGSTSGSTQR